MTSSLLSPSPWAAQPWTQSQAYLGHTSGYHQARFSPATLPSGRLYPTSHLRPQGKAASLDKLDPNVSHARPSQREVLECVEKLL